MKTYNKTEVVCEAVKHTINLDECVFRGICFRQLFQIIKFEVIKWTVLCESLD